MKRLLILLAFITICVAQKTTPQFQNKIVGGQNTTILKVPYQVLFQKSDSQWCGGSIISKSYILSAAHCFEESTDPSNYTVRVGSSYSNCGGEILPVDKIVIHPNYNNTLLNNDFALIRLKNPIKKFTSEVNKIALASAGISLKAGTLAKASGWGQLDKNNTDLPTRIQDVNLPLASFKSCRLKFGSQLTRNMLCAASNSGTKGICQGKDDNFLEDNSQGLFV
jgi:secreted trypsin-like serine protease